MYDECRECEPGRQWSSTKLPHGCKTIACGLGCEALTHGRGEKIDRATWHIHAPTASQARPGYEDDMSDSYEAVPERSLDLGLAVRRRSRGSSAVDRNDALRQCRVTVVVRAEQWIMVHSRQAVTHIC